ncbi:MAG TPA: hypothetical protein VJR23_14700 [Candidatus Acidoferrales bacterium]|nr:hypothetical protein [Candidatus Acidoferrales bacterium]
MNAHPYVRAYMAGTIVPTLFLIVVLTGFVVVRLVLQFSEPVERIIIFPMAAVPNIWGLWNMLYVRVREGRNYSIGLHGALLPFLLGPLGAVVGCLLGILTLAKSGATYFVVVHIHFGAVAAAFCIAVVIYYLAWKYFVNFFNGVVGIE